MERGCDCTINSDLYHMDKKALLAAATQKLERQPVTESAAPAEAPARDAGRSRTRAKDQGTGRGAAAKRVEPVVSKGITLRPANVEKLDRLELSLRKQGIKAGHSGLIQIAIDLLEDNSQLAESYRDLLKLDLRLR